MKKLWLLAILLSAGPGPGFTQTTQELVNDGRNTENVTIASGLGGVLANRYAADKVPTGGSIWTFAVMPE